jgi:hypothetical protein
VTQDMRRFGFQSHTGSILCNGRGTFGGFQLSLATVFLCKKPFFAADLILEWVCKHVF